MKKLLILTLMIAALSPLAHGQGGNTGTVLGTVTDPAGAFVAGAHVTVANEDTGLSRSATTDSAGDYVVTLLPIGRYRVAVETSGFATAAIEHVVVQIDARVRIDIALKVGQVKEQVTVSGQAPVIQTDSASLGSIVSEVMIKELPLNGREFLGLSFLTAGAVPTDGMGNTSYQGEGVSQIGSVYGQTENNSSFRLDGIETSEWSGAYAVLKPSVDAVQEFSIQKGISPAAYGKSAGGIINASTKSGTNQFGGSAFWFVRNDIFDARNFFNPNPTPPPYRRNQFGGTFGGPVIHNKSFVFGSYEGSRNRQGSNGAGLMPTLAMRGGDFSAIAAPVIDPTTGLPFPGNIIPAARIQAASASLLAFYPTPSNSQLPPNINYYESASSKIDSDHFVARGDHYLGPKDQLFGRFAWERTSNASPSLIPYFGLNITYHDLGVALGETHAFSSNLLNDARIGYTRIAFQFGDINQNPGIAAQLGIPGVSLDPRFAGIPYVNISGYPSLGVSPATPFYKTQNSFEYIDDLLYRRNKHSLKFGVDIQREQEQQLVPLFKKGYFIFDGSYTGNAFADFLLGDMGTTIVGATNDVTAGNLRTTNLFLYAQDDWQVTPRLTLNLGLRYEYPQPPWDRYGKTRNFDLQTVDLFPAPDTPGVPLVNSDKNNFAPRIGFAFRPLNNNNTVIRGGYGIYYNQAEYDAFLFLPYNPPYGGVSSFSGNPIVPNLTWADPFPAGGQNPSGAPNAYGVDRNFKTGYVQYFSLNAEHQIMKDTKLAIGWVGSKSTNLAKRIDMNGADPSPLPVQPRRYLSQNFSSIPITFSQGKATYNGLTVELERRYAQGLYLTGSYVWSKTLSDVFSAWDYYLASYQDPRCTQTCEKGLASQDVRHRFVVSAIWDLPVGKGHRLLPDLKGPLQYMLAGWEVGAIISAQGGQPQTVNLPGDPLHTGLIYGGSARPDLTGNPNLSGSQRSVDQWFNTAAFTLPAPFTPGTAGQGIVIGPGIVNADLSLYKNFTLTERFKLQFRSEFFNAFNHTNFLQPNVTFGTPGFGKIFGARNSRDIQFALKLMF
jgi:outer membrane receptor protein involved in Fe transport